MFGLFKKKEAPRPAVSINDNVVEKAAALLNIQLMLCRFQPDYKTGLEQERVRGYLIGFFDCALQKLGKPLRNDEEFAMHLVHGHSCLLGADLADVRSYVFASLCLQDNPRFAQGQADGGNDCNELLIGRSTQAVTLIGYFIES